MKKIKKLGVVAIVIAMCALLGITVWATDANATSFSYTVEANDTELCISDEAQTVTVTVKANKVLDVNSVGATIALQGCTLVENSFAVPGMVADDIVLYTNGEFAWIKDNSENITTQTLLTFQVKIPANAAVGDYKIEVKDVILTQLTEGTETEFAMITLTSKTATADVTVKLNEHVYVAGDYNWTGAKENTACTVLGTCECGVKATVTATVISKVEKPATCLDGGSTTYTATFKETWAQMQTMTMKDIDQLDHSYTGAAQSNGNGKDATHSFMCVNGCQQYGGAVAHTWDEGKVTTNPDCLSTGTKTYTCEQDKCGATYTEDVAADGHTFGETVAANDATCTAPGNEAYKHCDACEKFFAADAATDSTDGKDSADAFVIAAAGHSFGETVAANDATCMAPGNEAYKHCDACEKFFAADAATDSTDGKDSADAFAIAIDENAHDFATEISGYEVDAENGTHKAFYTCSRNETHKKYDEAEPHDFTNGDCVCGAEKPAPAGVKGDVNGDGLVNSADLTVLARHVGGIEFITDEAALANADVNGDGEINSADLTKHARYVGGIITDWSQE